MCPDPQILSIYMDGELPSPWKEKMEAHLAACPACKEKFANYRHVQDLIKKGASLAASEQRRTIVDLAQKEPEHTERDLLESSKEKVWKKIASRQRLTPGGLVRKGGDIRGYGVWRRKINIPVPIAIAATLIIIFGVAVLLRMQDLTNKNNFANQIAEYQNFLLAAEDEIPILPASMDYMNDMNDVLKYLGTDGADIIILQLPESRNFSRFGDPIIKAADYSQTRGYP